MLYEVLFQNTMDATVRKTLKAFNQDENGCGTGTYLNVVVT